MNAKAITTYMGHASIQTTYDLYGKLMPGSEAEAAALVDAYLNRSTHEAALSSSARVRADQQPFNNMRGIIPWMLSE